MARKYRASPVGSGSNALASISRRTGSVIELGSATHRYTAEPIGKEIVERTVYLSPTSTLGISSTVRDSWKSFGCEATSAEIAESQLFSTVTDSNDGGPSQAATIRPHAANRATPREPGAARNPIRYSG